MNGWKEQWILNHGKHGTHGKKDGMNVPIPSSFFFLSAISASTAVKIVFHGRNRFGKSGPPVIWPRAARIRSSVDRAVGSATRLRSSFASSRR